MDKEIVCPKIKNEPTSFSEVFYVGRKSGNKPWDFVESGRNGSSYTHKYGT